MIKQTLLAAALIAGLTAPAFAADGHHGDRGQGNQGTQSQRGQQTQHGQQDQHGQRGQTNQGQNYGGQNGNRDQYNGRGNYGQGQRYAPPAPRYERRPQQSGRNMVWQPGYYRGNGGNYDWVPGQYAQAPYYGANWQPAIWVNQNGIYVFIDGYWF